VDAAVPRQRQITIQDRTLAPPELRVPAGATVEFVNAGKRFHRVLAERGVWSPIILPPRGRARVRLLVPGRYPYKVDGRLKGLVIAGAPIAGFSPRPGSALTELETRYAVRIDARIREQTTHSGSTNPASNGTETADLTWTIRIPSLLLRHQGVGLNVTVGTRASRGTFVGRFVFSDTRASTRCADSVDYTGLVSEVLLQGSRQDGKASVSLDAGLVPASADRYEQIRRAATRGAGCESINDADWLDEQVPVDRGVRIHHPPSFSIAAWDSRWSREGRGTPFPLDAILAGRGFTVSSGTRSFSDRSCGSGCTESFTGSVRYVFTPLPPPRP
jgi:hypothetical protein